MFYRSLNRERDDDEDGDDEDEMVDRLADRMFNDRLLGNEEGEAQALGQCAGGGSMYNPGRLGWLCCCRSRP